MLALYKFIGSVFLVLSLFCFMKYQDDIKVRLYIEKAYYCSKVLSPLLWDAAMRYTF